MSEIKTMINRLEESENDNLVEQCIDCQENTKCFCKPVEHCERGEQSKKYYGELDLEFYNKNEKE